MSHTKNKRHTIEIEMIGVDVGCRLNGIILSARHASITMMNGHTMESNCEFINDDYYYCYYYTRFVAHSPSIQVPFTLNAKKKNTEIKEIEKEPIHVYIQYLC